MDKRSTDLFLKLMRCYLRGEQLPFEEGPANQAELEKVLELAGQHHVLPILFDTVGRARPDLPDMLDRSQWLALRRSTMGIVSEQVRKRAAFADIYSKLTENALKPLVVKGIIVAAIYPSPDCRISSDEDLLVRSDEFDACARVLIEAGMIAQDEENAVRLFIEPTSGLRIELHTALIPSYMSTAPKMNAWFTEGIDHAITAEIDGMTYYTLSHTDHFLYLVCHAFKHFVHSGFGIRQFCDCMLYAVAYIADIDWDLIWSRVKEVHADVFLANLRAISEERFGCDFYNPVAHEYEGRIDPDDLLADILEGGVYGYSRDARRQSSTITLQALNASNGEPDAVTGSGRRAALFPPLSALKGRYTYLKKAPFLLPIAWLQRLFGFLIKRSKGEVASPNEILETGRLRTQLLAKYGVIDE